MQDKLPQKFEIRSKILVIWLVGVLIVAFLIALPF